MPSVFRWRSVAKILFSIGRGAFIFRAVPSFGIEYYVDLVRKIKGVPVRALFSSCEARRRLVSFTVGH